MSTVSALAAHDLSRRYGRIWAVRHVSLAFAPGSVNLIVGHNGSGKTTLIQILAGASRPTEGHTTVFGHDIHSPTGQATARQRVAYLGHKAGVYAELTGMENLLFFASLYRQKMDHAELEARLDRVGLGHAKNRPVSTYSRGMIQRLSLARIDVQGARIWLLDEPMTGLDDAGRAAFVARVRGARDEGVCVVAITHDPALFSDVTDQTFTLKNGRLQAGEDALC